MNEILWKNQGGLLTQLLISQLLFALEYLTWYQSKGKAWYFCLMDGYENNLIWTFINLNRNNRNEWKITEKSKQNTYKLLIAQLFIALEYQTWYQSNA